MAPVPPMKMFNVSTSGNPNGPATQTIQCRVNPVAVMSILDADVRRPEGASRTIGSLLGNITDGNVLEITDAFPVPHQDVPAPDAEGTNVLMDQDYHRNMVALRQKVTPKESVIGWFSTGGEINESSVVIDTFYKSLDSGFQPGQLLQSPLHLLIHTAGAEHGKLSIKAHLRVETSVASDLAQFHQIPMEIKLSDETGSKKGMTWLYETLMKTDTSLDQNVDIFQQGLADLEYQFQETLKYVRQAKKGEVPPDHGLGRAISKALEEIPDFNSTVGGDKSVAETSVLDSLMVVYLSNLAKVQVNLAEKVAALPAFELSM